MLDTEVSSNENRWFAFGERKPPPLQVGEDVTCIGIGHVYYNGRHYWVEEFAKRSNINTTGTDAVNETKTVPVTVAQSNITGFSAVFDKKSYALRVGEKVSPEFTGSVVYINGFTRPVADIPSISVEDSSIASYDGKQLTGIAEGTTSLKATLYGLSASSAPTVSVHDCNNHWDSGKVTTNPTCTQKGEKTFTCTICNNTKAEEVAPNGHDYAKEWTLDVAPTCEKEGTESRHCKFCEEKTEVKSVLALGHIWKDNEDGTAICTREGCGRIHTHVWDKGAITKEATCEAAGEKTYHCTYGENCTAAKIEEIGKLGHDYKVVKTVPATCEEAGKIYYECSRCEVAKEEEDKTALALGHIWKDKGDGTAICTRADCGETHTHVWDEGTITKKATYTSQGEVTYTCEVCGQKRKEVTPKLTYPKAGTLYNISGNQYKVVKAGAEVSFIRAQKNAKSITIPATVKINGILYKVVTIEAKAFNNNKKLSKVTVGSNVIKINNNAFFKCKNLKNVEIKSISLTKKTASKKAFVSANKKLVIKVPKKVKKVYVRIFKGIKVK